MPAFLFAGISFFRIFLTYKAEKSSRAWLSTATSTEHRKNIRGWTLLCLVLKHLELILALIWAKFQTPSYLVTKTPNCNRTFLTTSNRYLLSCYVKNIF